MRELAVDEEEMTDEGGIDFELFLLPPLLLLLLLLFLLVFLFFFDDDSSSWKKFSNRGEGVVN